MHQFDHGSVLTKVEQEIYVPVAFVLAQCLTPSSLGSRLDIFVVMRCQSILLALLGLVTACGMNGQVVLTSIPEPEKWCRGSLSRFHSFVLE